MTVVAGHHIVCTSPDQSHRVRPEVAASQLPERVDQWRVVDPGVRAGGQIRRAQRDSGGQHHQRRRGAGGLSWVKTTLP